MIVDITQSIDLVCFFLSLMLFINNYYASYILCLYCRSITIIDHLLDLTYFYHICYILCSSINFFHSYNLGSLYSPIFVFPWYSSNILLSCVCVCRINQFLRITGFSLLHPHSIKKPRQLVPKKLKLTQGRNFLWTLRVVVLNQWLCQVL